MLADNILAFLKSLVLRAKLPAGVEVMNPYRNASAFALCTKFYSRFYRDHRPRTLILGINPGRFGGGITGIPFTDPVKLERWCSIKNDLPKKTELSADFIYQMIEAYGGVDDFYGKFYISAVCPLGFTKNGKNLNYYDLKPLQKAVNDFCASSIEKQLNMGLNRKRCYCLGEGQNFRFLQQLNQSYGFFEEIIPLPHPRFIMQYRRKRLNDFIKYYLNKLSQQ
jgi:hypothetical protein